MNYKKKILIIDIKMNKYCNIYKISSNKRQNLIKKWKCRTHEYTWTKLAKQYFCLKRDLKRDDNHMIIHVINNWIWKHELCNVHTLMNIDILYQLFKDIVIKLINWTIALIDEMFAKNNQDFEKQLKKRRKKEKNMTQSIAAI